MDHFPVHHGLIHVSLGAMRREYIPLFMPGINNPDVTKGLLLRPPVTLEAELAWYDSLTQKNDTLFAILLHEQCEAGTTTGYRYIGHTGLHNLTWPDGHAVSGTVVADPTCLGKGFGTEAKLLLLYEAFRNRGLRKVCSHVKVFNGNSWGHLLASGYQQVGRHKAHHFHDGDFIDSIDLEIFREDWEPVWQAYQDTKSLPRLTREQRKLLQKETRTS